MNPVFVCFIILSSVSRWYVVRLSGKIFFDSDTDLGSFDSITHHSGHDLTTYVIVIVIVIVVLP